MTTPTQPVSWRCPAAKLVLPAGADRALWLAERRKGLGGSDASTVAGLNRYDSLYALWLDKTGQVPEKQRTQRMRMGNLLEPLLIQIFTEDTGIQVQRRGLMRSREHPFMQVSVDGVTADGGLVEAKTTNWRTEDAKIWMDGDVPDHAEAQSQWGLAVTGRSHCYAMVLIDGAEFLWRRIDRNQRLIDELTARGRWLWFDHVVPRVAPPVDGSDATRDALKGQYRQVEVPEVAAGPEMLDVYLAWRVAKDAEKDAKADIQRLENHLFSAFGEAEALAVMGEQVATWKQNGRFSAKTFAEHYPDLAAACVRTVEEVDAERVKREHPAAWAACRGRVLRAVKK